MNTITAVTSRVPRTGLIAVVVLVVAFAALMVARSGLLGGSGSGTTLTESPTPAVPRSAPGTSATPNVVLLPGLPSSVAQALRKSRVAVVSLYVGQAQSDRAWVAEARKGARTAGARFVAVNVGSDKTAAAVRSFVGAASTPSMLVVRRPGRIVTQISGPVDSAVVAQAAHNAGARR